MHEPLPDSPRRHALRLVQVPPPGEPSDLDEAALRRLAAAVVVRLAADLKGAPPQFGAPILSRQWADRFFTSEDPGLQFWPRCWTSSPRP